MNSVIQLIIVLFALLQIFSSVKSESLQAVKRGQLPLPLFLTSAVYDGDDSIYIMGGASLFGAIQNKVLKYCLTSETVEEVSQFPRPLTYGTAHVDSKGDIFYIGGFDGISHDTLSGIWKLRAQDRKPTLVGNLTAPLMNHGGAWIVGSGSNNGASDGIYLIGGTTGTTYEPYIVKFDPNISQLEKVGEVGITMDITVATSLNGLVYIFDAQIFSHHGDVPSVRVFNPVTSEVQVLPTLVPLKFKKFQVVSIEETNTIYLVGGKPEYPGYFPTQLMKFDVTASRFESLEVTNFPETLQDLSAVYVPQLKRIYVIGGMDSTGVRTDIVGIDI